jgi:antitoxin HicB
MSDGETAEEALANVKAAIDEWIEEAKGLGRTIPRPSYRVAAAE